MLWKAVFHIVSVFVGVGIQHEIPMRHFVTWPAPFYKIFPRFLINGTIYEKRVIEHKMGYDFLHNFCLKHFSFS